MKLWVSWCASVFAVSRVPPSATATVTAWRDWIEQRASDNLDALADVVDDQEAFAKLSKQFCLTSTWAATNRRRKMRATILAMMIKMAENEDAESESGAAEQPDGSGADDMTEADDTPEGKEQTISMDMEEDDTEGEGEETGEAVANMRREPEDDRQKAFYKVFTQRFDEVVEAEDLCDPEN